MPYLAHSQIWLNLPTDDSHWGYISKLTQKFIHPHFCCCWLVSPSALLRRSARARVAGNARLIGPWANRAGWIDPHIGITVKAPKTHLNGHIRPQNLYIWTLGRWFSIVGKWHLHLFRIFMGNLNELCGFYHDPNVGVNLPWLGEPGLLH